jgi:putative membrane protein
VSNLFDSGLQPERTALAWRRTGLALLAGSLVAARVMFELLGVVGLVIGGIGLATAVAVLVSAEQRYRNQSRRLADAGDDGGAALAGGVLPALVALAVLMLAIAAAVIVVLLALPGPA